MCVCVCLCDQPNLFKIRYLCDLWFLIQKHPSKRHFTSQLQIVLKFVLQMSRQYELLNYSEHGTTVDNVLYSCDFSDKPATTPQASKMVQSVRDMIDVARGRKQSPQEEKQFMNAHSGKVLNYTFFVINSSIHHLVRLVILYWKCLVSSCRLWLTFQIYRMCSCKTSSSSLIGGSGAGWEGTAILRHGSYIKLGCMQFVFSIVEQATRDPLWEKAIKREGSISLLKSQFKEASSWWLTAVHH